MGNQRTLQTEILERMIGPKKMQELLAEYNGARKRGGSYSDRASALEATITEEELALVEMFVTETDTTLRELAESLRINSGANFSYKAGQIALRWIHQNSETVFNK